MANEITISTSFQVANGIDRDAQSFTAQFTQSGTDSNGYTLTVTDAGYTALGKENIGSLGLCCIRNLSSTAGDIVYISRNGGTTNHEQLGPQAWLLTWLKTDYDITTMQIKAATGKTVLVRVWLKEA
jgi:hypothetical protein